MEKSDFFSIQFFPPLRRYLGSMRTAPAVLFLPLYLFLNEFTTDGALFDFMTNILT